MTVTKHFREQQQRRAISQAQVDATLVQGRRFKNYRGQTVVELNGIGIVVAPGDVLVTVFHREDRKWIGQAR